MRKIINKLIFVLFVVLSPGPLSAGSLEDLKFFGNEYPPFQYSKGGQPQGIAVDIIAEMFDRAGIAKTTGNITFVPWARGLHNVQNIENTLLLSVIRTPTREKLFKWVGPFNSKVDIVLLARKESHIRISSPVDLNRYNSIVIAEDVGQQLMLKVGTDPANLYIASSYDHALKMLQNKDRFQLWAINRFIAFWQLKQLGYDPADYETVYTLLVGEQYFALHKDTDDTVVKKLQQSLDDMKADGSLKKIIDSYLQ